MIHSPKPNADLFNSVEDDLLNDLKAAHIKHNNIRSKLNEQGAYIDDIKRQINTNCVIREKLVGSVLKVVEYDEVDPNLLSDERQKIAFEKQWQSIFEQGTILRNDYLLPLGILNWRSLDQYNLIKIMEVSLARITTDGPLSGLLKEQPVQVVWKISFQMNRKGSMTEFQSKIYDFELLDNKLF